MLLEVFTAVLHWVSLLILIPEFTEVFRRAQTVVYAYLPHIFKTECSHRNGYCFSFCLHVGAYLCVLEDVLTEILGSS